MLQASSDKTPDANKQAIKHLPRKQSTCQDPTILSDSRAEAPKTLTNGKRLHALRLIHGIRLANGLVNGLNGMYVRY